MNKLTLMEKVAYGCGDLASNLIFNAVTTYLMFFYTESVGISVAIASTLFLVARIWDAISDPMMGAISDRTRTRWGRFRPYLLFVPIPFAIVSVLAYTSPDFSLMGKTIWACATYFLLMTFYTAVNIPYASLATAMTSDNGERAQLTTYRMIFSFSGGMVVNVILMPMVYWYSGGDDNNIAGYQFAIAVLAAISVILYFTCFFFTKERVVPQREIKPELKTELKIVTNTREWWSLLVMGCMMFALGIFPFYAGMYYLKYVFLDETFASTYFTTLTIGMLCGALINLVLVRYFSARNLAIFAGLWGAVFSMCSLSVTPGDSTFLLFFGLLGFMGTGMGAPNLWAMVGDTTDLIEQRTGRRIAGLTAAAVSFSMKLGLGIGGSVVGYILAYQGFEANVEANEGVRTSIVLMISVFPAVGYAIFSGAAITFPTHLSKPSSTTQISFEKA